MAKLISRAEYDELVKNIPPDVCALCELKDQTILGSSKYWLWIPCIAPYWRYHTMFIPKTHREDITELTTDEFTDLQSFYLKVKNHMLSLGLSHVDGKLMDQFILMVRIREDIDPSVPIRNKPKHLHIHFCPDREVANRFQLDDTAVGVDIGEIALP